MAPPFDMMLSQSQRQEQTLSVQTLQRMALLTLPVTELQQRIQKEVEENPALEIPDGDFSADEQIPRAGPDAGSRSGDDDTEGGDFVTNGYGASDYGNDGYGIESGSYYGLENGYCLSADDGASDRKNAFIENSARDEQSIQSYLTDQLGVSDIPQKLREVCEMIITSLDSNGFYTRDPHALVDDPDESGFVDEAVTLIRGFDPPGVCVPDFKESLIEQARRSGLSPADLDNFTKLIREHFMDLKPGRFESIAKAMGLSEEDIDSYYAFLRTLAPYPGAAFASGDESYVVPELSIRKVDGSLTLSMNKAGLPDLELAPGFSSLADGLKGKDGDEARRFISESIEKAKLLISQIELRYNTLYKTALALMELQKDFFLEGPEKLRPLILKDVAQKVGVHETTISRISQAKWIDTDWGLFQMKELFTQGLQTTGRGSEDGGSEISRSVVKQKIAKIIEEDKSGKKLSDQKLADMLSAEGIKIARRTVAKYRAELNLDSSFDR